MMDNEKDKEQRPNREPNICCETDASRLSSPQKQKWLQQLEKEQLCINGRCNKQNRTVNYNQIQDAELH